MGATPDEREEFRRLLAGAAGRTGAPSPDFRTSYLNGEGGITLCGDLMQLRACTNAVIQLMAGTDLETLHVMEMMLEKINTIIQRTEGVSYASRA